jgi:hypothetical protein
MTSDQRALAVRSLNSDGTSAPSGSASDPTFVAGNFTNPTASFTRPADTTAYALGDLVAASTTAATVQGAPLTITVARSAGGSFMLRRCKLHKTGTSTTNASFRVHFFRAAPATVTNGDNGAFSVSGVADYVGAFDVTIDRAFTDGSAGFGLPVAGSEMSIDLASGTTLVWFVEARAAYTPTSGEVFTLSLDDLQN